MRMEHLAKRSGLRTGFYGDFVNGNYNVKIEEFEFADGTKWNTSQIEASVQIFGTEGADSITGSFSNDVISSGDGNDTINSNSGNDTVLFRFRG